MEDVNGMNGSNAMNDWMSWMSNNPVHPTPPYLTIRACLPLSLKASMGELPLHGKNQL